MSKLQEVVTHFVNLLKTSGSDVTEKELEKTVLTLYLALSFSVARKVEIDQSDNRRTTTNLFSPFWIKTPETYKATELCHDFGGINDTNYLINSDTIKLPVVSYDGEGKEYRKFCDQTMAIVFAHLGTIKVMQRFVETMLGRTGAIKVRRTDISGFSISYEFVRPIIGRYYNSDLFTKTRDINPNRTQALVYSIKSILGTGEKTAKIAFAGTVSTEPGQSYAPITEGVVDLTISLLGGWKSYYKDEPVFIDMRDYCIRCKDVIKLLTNITDEILRQQREPELQWRDKKKLFRESLHPSTLIENRVSAESLSYELMNQIEDVAVQISLGFFAVYKLYVYRTGQKDLNPTGEKNEELKTRFIGEIELFNEALSIIIESKTQSRVKKFLKLFASSVGERNFTKKTLGSFRAYETDMRDAIQDVELALSTYRLRLDAENDLYLSKKLHGLVNKLAPDLTTHPVKQTTFNYTMV